MRVLVTDATGKVGQNLLPAFLASDRFAPAAVVAPCKPRVLEPHRRTQMVKVSPDLCRDVSVARVFPPLETFRASPDAERRAAALPKRIRGPVSVEIATSVHGNRLGLRARPQPGWHTVTDLEVPIERAWSFEQSPDEPRRIRYPG